ncbi:hypothetical protein BTVI_34322 [Pitangus sulphuratus]|nr:hypothetical protein BTVI_34322 [Pitangus sulphuratus]
MATTWRLFYTISCHCPGMVEAVLSRYFYLKLFNALFVPPREPEHPDLVLRLSQIINTFYTPAVLPIASSSKTSVDTSHVIIRYYPELYNTGLSIVPHKMEKIRFFMIKSDEEEQAVLMHD